MKRIVAIVLALALLIALAACATEDDKGAEGATYPEYSVTIVCPFGSGGDTDTTARGMAAALSEVWGKSVTVNNVTGGTGTVALSYMYNANPDGYTLMWYQTDMIYQTLLGRTEKAWDEAFKVVGVCCEGTTDTIFVRADSNFYTMQDIIDYAKANPGKLNFATEAGGNLHMTILKLEHDLDIDVNPVSLGGGGKRVTALLAGEVDVNMGAYGASAEYIESGDFRAIAVLSSTENTALFAHAGYTIPSLKDACGIEDINLYKMFFLLAPEGTPDDVMQILYDSLPQAIENANFTTSLESYFYSPVCKIGDEALEWMHQWEKEYEKLCAYYEA